MYHSIELIELRVEGEGVEGLSVLRVRGVEGVTIVSEKKTSSILQIYRGNFTKVIPLENLATTQKILLQFLQERLFHLHPHPHYRPHIGR